jgi:hypothetical protein
MKRMIMFCVCLEPKHDHNILESNHIEFPKVGSLYKIDVMPKNSKNIRVNVNNIMYKHIFLENKYENLKIDADQGGLHLFLLSFK